jgi:hypothetical protein
MYYHIKTLLNRHSILKLHRVLTTEMFSLAKKINNLKLNIRHDFRGLYYILLQPTFKQILLKDGNILETFLNAFKSIICFQT